MRGLLVTLLSCLAVPGCSVIVGCSGAGEGQQAGQGVTSQGFDAEQPVSDLFDIGGRKLYLECDGTGDPTVLLEPGLAGDHQTWELVMPRISSSTRVCSYDRANVSPSDPARAPRTASDVVADLHTLLNVAKEEPPYLLVGFSFGGLTTQLYASSRPDEVAGLVLVESNHPDEVEQFEAELTPAQIERDREFTNANPEGIDMYASFAEAQRAAALPDVPLVVVTAGRSIGWPRSWDADVFDQLRAEHQADLARITRHGTQIVARKSSHEVPLQQPGAIVKAVEAVLAKTG